MDGESLFFLAISILLAFEVEKLSEKRKIGFGMAFLFAIVNLFLGLIIVLCSKKKSKDVDFVDIENQKEEDI